MSSGGSKTQTTTTSSDVPAWAKPYFTQALGAASNLANEQYTPYTGQMVAGLSNGQQLAQALTTRQALNTSGLDAGTNFATNLLSGQGQYQGGTNPYTGATTSVGTNPYAGSNPYLDTQIQKAQQDVTDQYTRSTVPNMLAQFNAGGAYGGTAMADALSQSQKNLASELGNVENQFRFNDYTTQQGLAENALNRSVQAQQTDLARNAGLADSALGRNQDAWSTYQNAQLGALGQLPALNQAGYYGSQILGQQGAVDQATQQSALDAAYNQYIDQRDWSANRLGILGNLLGSINGGTTTSTGANPNYRSAGQNILGGALTLGGMALMSDRNAKTDKSPANPERGLLAIRKIPLENWRYKGDDAGHVGTYSQDFYRALGQEPRTTIDPVDMFGALTGAVKALDKKVNRR